MAISTKELNDKRRKYSSFYLAARTNDIDLLRKHLSQGLDINHGNIMNRTALHLAAKHANFEAVSFLSNQPGIDIDGKPERRIATPLYDALRYFFSETNEEKKLKFLKIIQHLLEKGADPTRGPRKNMVRLNCTQLIKTETERKHNDAEMIRNLFNKDYTQVEKIDDRTRHSTKEEEQDDEKRRYLSFYHAAYENDIIALKKYLSQGIDINRPDWKRETALHWATFNGCFEAVVFLSNLPDINVDKMHENSRTPLCIALSHFFSATDEKMKARYLAIIECLLKRGADPTKGPKRRLAQINCHHIIKTKKVKNHKDVEMIENLFSKKYTQDEKTDDESKYFMRAGIIKALDKESKIVIETDKTLPVSQRHKWFSTNKEEMPTHRAINIELHGNFEISNGCIWAKNLTIKGKLNLNNCNVILDGDFNCKGDLNIDDRSEIKAEHAHLISDPKTIKKEKLRLTPAYAASIESTEAKPLLGDKKYYGSLKKTI